MNTPMKAKQIKGKAQSREAMLDFLKTATGAIDMQYPVDINITTDTGVLDCYSVFWIWMRHMTKHLKKTYPGKYDNLTDSGELEGEYSKKTCMHDIVCDAFLGETKATKVGKKVVLGRMKTLTSPRMNKGELIDLLRKIEEWSIEMGIILPQPTSEYTEAR
jgi:hypothetical protein